MIPKAPRSPNSAQGSSRKPKVDVVATTKHVLGVIRLLPKGAPPAALREHVPLDKAQWVAFINDACAKAIVRKTGERRGTRYFLGPKAGI